MLSAESYIGGGLAKSITWSADKYRYAILGDEHFPGLRSVIEGFDASDGYDLRHIARWSASKKRRVRDYHGRVHHLLAQERRVVRPRNRRNLRRLQESFHGDIASGKFKVAFVPYTDPAQLQRKGKGLKPGYTRIRYTRGGIVFDTATYARRYESFDKSALARKPAAEVRRAISEMPGAKLFFIKVGQFQMLNGLSAELLVRQVLKYQEQYDGVKALPRSSGNRGDAPESHHWELWLDGVYGFSFPKTISTSKMQSAITEGMLTSKFNRMVSDFKAGMNELQKKNFDILFRGYLALKMNRDAAAAKASALVKRTIKYGAKRAKRRN